MNSQNGEIRIGVYVCHCGNNISETVDVVAVVEHARTLKGVVVARDYKFMCSDPGQEVVKQDIRDFKLNRIVVSSCSPRMHEETFRRVCEQAGVNRYEFQMANIREHCSWVTEDKTMATIKAKALVQAAVTRVFFHEPLKTKKVKVNPHTLVVGGGVAGIQAALEIANSGNKVYLVEKEPSIGGNMAKLDKTFPTLDCSACILTPKMVSVGQHDHIELMSYSEVENVSGSVGNFKVKIRKKARYVNAHCTACGECLKVCPVSLPDMFEEGLSMRHAIFRPFAQSVPNMFVIDKKENPPCKAVCPIGMDVQGYIALIRAGKLREAYDLMRQTNPLPAVCGRVCYHPCEDVCKRKALDEPVSILALKRYVTDHLGDYHYTPPKVERIAKRIAIIGSGPAGLTAAHDLALKGYEVTIFESAGKPGGMLQSGIPEYRLPRDILDKEISEIEALGVTIITKMQIGVDKKLSTLQREFDAVLIAVGTHKVKRLPLDNLETEGVINAMDFLKKVNYDEPVELGKKVGVIGGGNVAIDAARVAKRLGKDVTIYNVHLHRDEMFAYPDEVKAAVDDEGIDVEFLVAPRRIITENGKLKALELIRLDPEGEVDAVGMRPPLPGTEFTVLLDVMMPAIGLKPDTDFVNEAGIAMTDWATIIVNDQSLATNVEGTFACGDGVTGPTTVTEAMAQGRKAGLSIDRFLQGESLTSREKDTTGHVTDLEVSPEELQNYRERYRKKKRARVPQIANQFRLAGFGEVDLGLSHEEALREAERCLSCGGCSDCGECIKVCQPGAIDYDMTDERVEIAVGNIIIATGYKLFDARRAKEYGYKKFDNVLSSMEFERLSNAAGPTGGKILLKDGREPESVAILHCIGSRDENYNRHCSRICCMHSLKFAHLVKEKTNAEVYEFYLDMRAYGKGYEEFFERVQKEKVNIIRGKVPEITDFAESPEEVGKLIVLCEDTLLGLNRRIPVDMVILSVGLEPQNDANKVARVFSLSRSSDGFFLEKHPKLDPMATMSDGILIAGCCQGPKDIPDTVAQGSGAAARALSVLTRGEVEIDAITAVISETLCSGCRICNNLCPYAAIGFDKEKQVSFVVEELCKGCGTCVAACPVSAIKASHFTDEQLFAEIDGLMAI